MNRRDELPPKHWKYVDDLTLAEALNLKEKLKEDKDKEWEEPVNFHNRTKHILPHNESKVQEQITKLQEYSIENQMKINKENSKNNAVQFITIKRLHTTNGD